MESSIVSRRPGFAPWATTSAVSASRTNGNGSMDVILTVWVSSSNALTPFDRYWLMASFTAAMAFASRPATSNPVCMLEGSPSSW